MRAFVRQLVPLRWRQDLAQWRRVRADRRESIRFAGKAADEVSAAANLRAKSTSNLSSPASVSLAQPIIPGQLFENKLHNIRQGAQLVNDVELHSGECLSFWHCIGKASPANGFLEGRNIVEGRLQKETGGGLCQLSSLLYHLALLARFEIVERHPHSIDIYREEDRFTPLGADATVAWGTKDLRFRNTQAFSIRLSCWLEESDQPSADDRQGNFAKCFRLRGCFSSLDATHSLRAASVHFLREAAQMSHSVRTVRVRTQIEGQIVATTNYMQRPGMLAA